MSADAIVTSVADTASSVEFLAANSGRKGVSIDNDSTSALFVKLGQSLDAEASSSVTLQDDDNAATTGVALFVVIDQPNASPYFQIGHFEFVSPTNANGSARLKTGTNAFVPVRDADLAASKGFTVHALAAEAGLESNCSGTLPVLIPIYDGTNLVTLTGKYLRIANLSAASSAPQIFFDEDAVNDFEKLMLVVVDNADETVKAFDFTTTASSTVFTVKMEAGDHYETPFGFTGTVTGIWSADSTGSARITEYV